MSPEQLPAARAAVPPAVAGRGVPSGPGLRPIHLAVLRAVAQGHVHPRSIAAVTDRQVVTISRVLYDLIRTGALNYVGPDDRRRYSVSDLGQELLRSGPRRRGLIGPRSRPLRTLVEQVARELAAVQWRESLSEAQRRAIGNLESFADVTWGNHVQAAREVIALVRDHDDRAL